MILSFLLFRGRTGSQKIRLERFNGILSYTDAFAFVSEFYTDKSKHAVASEMFQTGWHRLRLRNNFVF